MTWITESYRIKSFEEQNTHIENGRRAGEGERETVIRGEREEEEEVGRVRQ